MSTDKEVAKQNGKYVIISALIGLAGVIVTNAKDFYVAKSNNETPMVKENTNPQPSYNTSNKSSSTLEYEKKFPDATPPASRDRVTEPSEEVLPDKISN